MRFDIGDKVRVVKLRDSYSKTWLGKTCEVRLVSGSGYHVVRDGDGADATFFEWELEAA